MSLLRAPLEGMLEAEIEQQTGLIARGSKTSRVAQPRHDLQSAPEIVRPPNTRTDENRGPTKGLSWTRHLRMTWERISSDSTVALLFAFFINAAILILAAATFHSTGNQEVADIGDAYRLLTPLLGTGIASVLFAVALLASGQNSTITGTLAGQIVMEGFLNIRLPAWLRRLTTRLIAIIPAVIVTALYGERGVGSLLILSQVILSLQLSFAVVPLVRFTSQKTKMGSFANGRVLTVGAWTVAVVIIGLNAWLLVGVFRQWMA